METVIITVAAIVLVEAIGFLAYKVFKINKELQETISNLSATTTNLNGLADCVLKLAKSSPNFDVVENSSDKSEDFNFPNSEGFGL